MDYIAGDDHLDWDDLPSAPDSGELRFDTNSGRDPTSALPPELLRALRRGSKPPQRVPKPNETALVPDRLVERLRAECERAAQRPPAPERTQFDPHIADRMALVGGSGHDSPRSPSGPQAFPFAEPEARRTEAKAPARSAGKPPPPPPTLVLRPSRLVRRTVAPPGQSPVLPKAQNPSETRALVGSRGTGGAPVRTAPSCWLNPAMMGDRRS